MTPVFSLRTLAFMVAFPGIIVSSVTYVFASSNTMYPDPAGGGTGDISGYVVSNVEYNLGNDPTMFKSVSFSLSAPATRVNIRLTDTQTDWSECINLGGNDWICDAKSMPVASANQLRVSASGN